MLTKITRTTISIEDPNHTSLKIILALLAANGVLGLILYFVIPSAGA